MKRFLLFRLYGPLASWGDPAVGATRPSAGEPSRSAVLGIVAAALGIRREDSQNQETLFRGYHCASSTDAPGTVLLDYHTVQGAKEKHFKKRPAGSRYEELAVGRKELDTFLTRREYRCDGAWTACLWAAVDPPPWQLEELAEALRRPRFCLYLGRKSCPPALPLAPTIVEAEHPLDALRDARFPDVEWLPRPKRRTFRWEAIEDPRALGMRERRDDPGDRMRRGFSTRWEYFSIEGAEEGGHRVPEQD